jgi:hypothetical protein
VAIVRPDARPVATAQGDFWIAQNILRNVDPTCADPRLTVRSVSFSPGPCLTHDLCEASVSEAEGGVVGIELELHSGRPGRKGSPRDTLLRGSYEHGEALARALSTLDRHGSGRLGRVDPYGDTLFNEQEAQVAHQEVAVLAQGHTDDRQKAALLDLAELLEECAATPGSYLWCMGD